MYKLIGADAKQYFSETPGTLGGHRKNKIYGKLDCSGAAYWIAKGHYVKQRVFFADEATAVAAGFRPCARCLPAAYAAWKQGRLHCPCCRRPRRTHAAGPSASSGRTSPRT